MFLNTVISPSTNLQQSGDKLVLLPAYFTLIVLGSRSFDADPIRAPENHLLLIITSHPERYRSDAVDGRLEFIKASPREIFDKYKRSGYQQMLVAGGARIATSFLKENLAGELWLTLEPRIFGEGSSFVTGKKLDITLELLSSEKVNEQGTLINKYRIIQ